MKIQNKHVIAWLESCAAHLTEQQDFLTALTEILVMPTTASI